MITVHHLENSRSLRVLWLLEELGLRYTVKRYARHPKTLLAPPELKQVHPLGKSPVITDHTGSGDITVAESGAIVEYLIDAHAQAQGLGSLRPASGSPEQRRYTYWLHFAEGSLMPPLLLSLVFSKVREAPVPFFIKPVVRAIADKVTAQFIRPNVDNLLAFMNSELAHTPWFAGDAFTAADIQLSYPLQAAQARGALDARHPRLLDWLKRIEARPAYQRALVAGGPYQPVP